MLKIFYYVDAANEAVELEWLKGQKIYPAIQKGCIVRDNDLVDVTSIGMIVDESAALAVKLRHPHLNHQSRWQKK